MRRAGRRNLDGSWRRSYPVLMDTHAGRDAGTSGIFAALEKARERGFVGRARELAAFADTVDGASEARVFFIHGPGGIGKTTLLDALARRAARRGRYCLRLDARDLVCSGAAVAAAIDERRRAAGNPPPGGEVLFIDGYELLEPLDRWFREELLPARPAGAVAVIASRNAPSMRWRTDPGWRGLLKVFELDAFGPGNSMELLARLGVEPASRRILAGLGRGYPLVLAMLADAGPPAGRPERLADMPGLVSQLCRMIVDDIPDAEHRTALATCAQATRMTEELLRRTVGARAAEAWDWLRARPYVSSGRTGLFLHDVVCELFEAEFLQRSPDDYVDLHRVIRDYFLEQLADPGRPDADRAAAELMLLHRRGPLSDEIAVLRRAGLPRIERAAYREHERILELIEQGEGIDVAQLARQWIEAQPEGLYRVRSDEGVEGFSVQVYLPEPTGIGLRDPVAAAIARTVAERAPLRDGERININRFAGASGAYQRDPTQLLVNGVACILEWFSQPAAWSFIVTFDPEHYGLYFEYLGFSPLVRVRYGGREQVAYGWDRRRFPPQSFFELMESRELSGQIGPPPADLLKPEPLARGAFLEAVRSALANYRSPDRLAGSPLLDTQLVQPFSRQPVESLRRTLRAGVRAASADRRGAESGRVLERTYLKGAPSQEAAAELLGLPFGTYRRHLQQALERVGEVLWAVEIGSRRLWELPGLEPEAAEAEAANRDNGQELDGK